MGFIIAIIIGAIAGWIAGQVVKGHGQGTLMNIVVGIIGGLLANWLFPALGWHLGAAPATVGNAVAGTSIIGSIIFSAIGAIILLLILRLFNRG